MSLAVPAPGLPGLPPVVASRTRRAWVPLLVASAALIGVLLAPTVCAVPREESVLEVVTFPSGAEVRVDDEYFGRTPLRLELAPGAHRLELTPAGGCPVDEHVELSPGAVTVLELVAPLY